MKNTLRLFTLFTATTMLAVMLGAGSAFSTPDRYQGEWVQVTDDRPAHLQEVKGPTISDVLAAVHKPARTVQKTAAATTRR